MPKKKKRSNLRGRKEAKKERMARQRLNLDEGKIELPMSAESNVSATMTPRRGKPLARIQASLTEKMSPQNALSLASPQGSLSTVYVCTTPISDSKSESTPTGVSVSDLVCTPMRVPWHNDGKLPCLADQTQLSSSVKDEMVMTKDAIESDLVKVNEITDLVVEFEKPDLITVNEKPNLVMNGKNTCISAPIQCHSFDTKSERKIETDYAFHGNDIVQTVSGKHKCKYDTHAQDVNNSYEKQKVFISNNELPNFNAMCTKVTHYKSIQGNFHQGNELFERNAGLQCVPNCLSALSYQSLKSVHEWKSTDLDNILMTGNELYDVLQKYCNISHRYLLISDLPENLHIHNELFHFSYRDSFSSLIPSCNDEEMPDLSQFNAKPLKEALMLSLSNSDGCFVCFGGNTMIVGKLMEGYFLFDSHSRSLSGTLTPSGKSTCRIVANITDVYLHIMNLAKSMKFQDSVECEVTGVLCKNSKLQKTGLETNHLNREDVNCVFDERAPSLTFQHIPVSTKKRMCKTQQIPCYEDNLPLGVTVNAAGAPLRCKTISRDGNCFFRAVSFALSGSEEGHHQIRSNMCNHVLQNADQFQSLLRTENQCLNAYIKAMSNSREWATEFEIIAVSHMLKVNIFTFTNNIWKKYAGYLVDNAWRPLAGALYLEHVDCNHYDVVESVFNQMCNDYNSSCAPAANLFNQNSKIKTRFSSLKRKIEECFDDLPKVEQERKRKRLWYQRKYQNDEEFRHGQLMKKKSEYKQMEYKNSKVQKVKKNYKEIEEYRNSLKMLSRKKYMEDIAHRNKVQEASKNKYKTNAAHKKKLMENSRSKYQNDKLFRGNVKEQSKAKYHNDKLFRGNVKEQSKAKYHNDKLFRENVKEQSKAKYQNNKLFRENAKEQSKAKYQNDIPFQDKVKEYSYLKYKTNVMFRDNIKEYNNQRYKEKNFKVRKQQMSKERYHKNASVKKMNLKTRKKLREKEKQKNFEMEHVIEHFKSRATEGPNYVCSCCHRLLFKNQVQECHLDQFRSKSETVRIISDNCISNKYKHNCSEHCPEKCTFSTLWLCKTCYRKISNGQIPAESAKNNLELDEIPEVLNDLNTLEKHLVALTIPFMKVTSLPKGGQNAIFGPVVCVPSDTNKVQILPRKQEDDMIVKVKLKRKLEYKGHYEFQFVNTSNICKALSFLKQNNMWYTDVAIDAENMNSLQANQLISNCEMIDDESNADECNAKTDENVNGIQYDTCLQPADIGQEVLDHYFDDVYNIAPSEGKNPVKILQEKGNEAMSFPHLFPTGKNTWTEDRNYKITLAKYFNNRLMHADNRFARDLDYIFFSQYLSELKQVIDKTQISLRKSFERTQNGTKVTAQMLKNPDVLKQLLKSDEALRFLAPIRGTPSFWQSVQKDLFAMLRQLGIPTWFCSFSAAEFRWNEFTSVLLQQQGDTRKAENLDWTEKSSILRSNPVTVARMFEHRFHVFLYEVILSSAEPIGKIKDYFYRVEFQQRGSPHVHCLFWVENAPNLLNNCEKDISDFIDRYITCSIPDESDDSKLHACVQQVQQHSKKHSKSCRKGGKECRFNFPRPPSCKTFISSPLEVEDESETNTQCRDEIKLQKAQAKGILQSMWDKIQSEEIDSIKTVENLFEQLNITQEVYEEAYKMVTSKQSVVLKRHPNELWTNQYNPHLLKCWDANMDIQYVLDPYSCIVYVVSYISKAEREMGMLLKQTKIEASEGNLNAKETMKKIGSAYLHHREVSAQEAVYRICNLKMRECSRKVVFVPVGENPTRLSKPLSMLSKEKNNAVEKDENANDDEEDVWMNNVVDRYQARPVCEPFPCMSLATFCSEYRVLSKSQIPQGEREGVYELQNNMGFVQKRTKTSPAIIRYPRFSSEKHAEKHFHSLLQLYLPYRNMHQLKPPNFDLYQSFYENGHVTLEGTDTLTSVKHIVDANYAQFALNEKVIDDAQMMFENLGNVEDAWATLCPETELERDICGSERNREISNDENADAIPDLTPAGNLADIPYTVTKTDSIKEDMYPLLRTLNDTQKKVLYHVRNWCLKKVNKENPCPFHIYVTGGAGTGKSHLIRTINFLASRLLQKVCTEPDKCTVLLTAFTGTAAFNIGGCTIHHAFSLNKYMPIPYEPLKEQTLSPIRTELEDLQILVIDEVSMVYKKLLYYIHERLVQIKQCKQPFGGVSILAVGDFYQLPPVKQRHDERLYVENSSYPVDFWNDYFSIVELKEIMRQKDDHTFAEHLNLMRVRTVDQELSETVLQMLKRCVRDGNEEALHVFSTNKEVNDHNLKMIKRNCDDLIEVIAKDFLREKTCGKMLLRETPFVRCKSDGLPHSLILSVNARVMLIRNVDVSDGLVNGVIGTVFEISVDNCKKEVNAVHVRFDNKNVGKKLGRKTQQGHIVFIKRVEEEMKTSTNKSFVRHQFPLRLAWACTAHKVQGMTTSEIVVNLDRVFSAGQAYVALSRVTTEAGLSISVSNDDIFKKKIFADKQVSEALLKMPQLFQEKKLKFHSIQKQKMIVVLHNIQSLPNNFIELEHDTRFSEADIICLTETWLSNTGQVERFSLDNFTFHQITRENAYTDEDQIFTQLKNSKGGGVATYIRRGRQIFTSKLPVKNIEGILLQDIPNKLTLVLIYRPSIYTKSLFLSYLKQLLEVLKQTPGNKIVLGDFNENLFTSTSTQTLMEEYGYQQFVTFPTTESGTLIDHVYSTLPVTEMETNPLPTYYSYHDAIHLIY